MDNETRDTILEINELAIEARRLGFDHLAKTIFLLIERVVEEEATK